MLNHFQSSRTLPFRDGLGLHFLNAQIWQDVLQWFLTAHVLLTGSAEVAQVSHWIEALRSRWGIWQPTPVGAVRETFGGLVLLASNQL